jgi:DNA invertase Pin-like site-specific DNA recombinase
MWQMIDVMPGLERNLIRERTRAGVKARWASGVKSGRRRKLTPEQVAHAPNLMEKGERSRAEIAALFRVGRKVPYRALAV